jgi:hypothetical protein
VKYLEGIFSNENQEPGFAASELDSRSVGNAAAGVAVVRATPYGGGFVKKQSK